VENAEHARRKSCASLCLSAASAMCGDEGDGNPICGFLIVSLAFTERDMPDDGENEVGDEEEEEPRGNVLTGLAIGFLSNVVVADMSIKFLMKKDDDGGELIVFFLDTDI
jgi:hypothetical protein